MNIRPLLSLFALALLPSALSAQPVPPPPAANQAIDTASGAWEGIVNIDVSVLVPDYREPWNAGPTSGGSGTGFLIGKNRFLTNAHVVSNATRILIRTTNDPEPHPAKIVHIAHDCDLALIEAEDGSHFE